MKTKISGKKTAFAAAILAASFSGSVLSGSAMAHETSPGAASQSGPEVSEQEARSLAGRYLRSLGATSPMRSSSTAIVLGADLKDGDWVVHVKFGGAVPSNSGIVYVDAETGAINENAG